MGLFKVYGIQSSQFNLESNYRDSQNTADKREVREDDPSDIASDEESEHNACQCLIHTRRGRDKGTGQLLFYKTGGQE